ncbi:hypothetical protein LINPERHAP2_LOCUS35512 [Linum perenne]
MEEETLVRSFNLRKLRCSDFNRSWVKGKTITEEDLDR